MPFALPPLDYPFEALEPHVDTQTMQIHHGKHHQAYVTNANNALAGTPLADAPVEDVIRRISELPDAKRNPVRNNAGGHLNHSLFWKWMAPPSKGGGGAPTGALGDAIKASFYTFDNFKEKFAGAGLARFGSGWVWLIAKKGGLSIETTANQDNPLMGASIAGVEGTPILGVDVWEHAYYLKYQNRRADYLAAWWNVVNWSSAADLFAKA